MAAVIDLDDRSLGDYRDIIRDKGLLTVEVPAEAGGNMNRALNWAVGGSDETGVQPPDPLTDEFGIIGFIGDDHRFRTPGWDLLVEDALDLGGIAYGDDLAQRQALPTQVFISSKIVEALGWMGLPGAKHLYLDNAWRTLGEGAGCLYYLSNVVIEHLHPAHNPSVPWDENHRRVNTKEMYEHDAQVYAKWLEHQASIDIQIVREVLRAHHH